MNYRKVVCIKIDNFKHHRKLKVGNIYNGVPVVTYISDLYDDVDVDFKKYHIMDIETEHEYGYYDKEFFIDLEEYRESKINKLLNG